MGKYSIQFNSATDAYIHKTRSLHTKKNTRKNKKEKKSIHLP